MQRGHCNRAANAVSRFAMPFFERPGGSSLTGEWLPPADLADFRFARFRRVA